jgi:hypothetical protein
LRCQNWHVAKEFTGLEPWHGKTSGYSGYRCRCDPCMETYRRFRRESYQRNKEKVGARNKAWKDANQGTVKATGRAYRAKPEVKELQAARVREWRAANVERVRARDRANRTKNRERILAYRREWADRNRERLRRQEVEWRTANRERFLATDRLNSQRRRAREREALIVPFTREQVFARMAYWGNRCYVCMAPWEAIDHVKPLRKGGAHCLANFRPICGYHNNRKKDRWLGVPWIRLITGAGDVTAPSTLPA